MNHVEPAVAEKGLAWQELMIGTNLLVVAHGLPCKMVGREVFYVHGITDLTTIDQATEKIGVGCMGLGLSRCIFLPAYAGGMLTSMPLFFGTLVKPELAGHIAFAGIHELVHAY